MTNINKRVVIIGGGTFNFVRAHFALSAPAFGETAKQMLSMVQHTCPDMDAELVLTKMADSSSNIITNEDLLQYVNEHIIADNTVKCVIFNAAVCDFDGTIDNFPSGKYAPRLKTDKGNRQVYISPSAKIIGKIRKHRKDIYVIGFKTTTGATELEQFAQGLQMLKSNSINCVIANDLMTRHHVLITPEEGAYPFGKDRKGALLSAIEMMSHRSHLSFTRSTVVSGDAVPWNSELVYPTLRSVVNFCIEHNAYKPFGGLTTGHFAAKISDTTFLTSIRKSNFNRINELGLVKVETDGPDSVISYGMKPSVGGQSQRIIFNKFTELDCIVHFHCPIKTDHIDDIPVVSQFEYECGSHECGSNTANNLKEIRPGIYAVMLDNHGPNIVFNHQTDPVLIQQFITDNFDLSKSASGFEQVYFV